jgi:predicted DNA-binding transcriptional regulator AlpA
MQRSQPPIATAAQVQTPVERLIRLNEVLTYTGEARTTCYDNIASGIHPAPLKDGRASLWKLSEVHAYVEQKIARLPRKG